MVALPFCSLARLNAQVSYSAHPLPTRKGGEDYSHRTGSPRDKLPKAAATAFTNVVANPAGTANLYFMG
jgi:hypothetical protein